MAQVVGASLRLNVQRAREFNQGRALDVAALAIGDVEVLDRRQNLSLGPADLVF
jgi:hypothetical protein